VILLKRLLEIGRVYAKRISNIAEILLFTYVVIALLYTTQQVFTGDFKLDLGKVRIQVSQAMVSPITK